MTAKEFLKEKGCPALSESGMPELFELYAQSQVNEALDRAIEIFERSAIVTSEGRRSRIEELQKLKR